MDTEDNLNFKCVRCGNCCTDPNTIVNLTYTDIIRMKEGLKLNLDELLEIVGFYVFTDDLDNNTRKRLVSSPIQSEKGLAVIALLKDETGRCIFYDATARKCKIYPLRPNLCRTFPFTFELRERSENLRIFLTEKGKDYCAGLIQDAPSINKSDMLKLGKKVLNDLKHNSEFILQWHSLVKHKKLKPSAKEFLRKVLSLEAVKKD